MDNSLLIIMLFFCGCSCLLLLIIILRNNNKLNSTNTTNTNTTNTNTTNTRPLFINATGLEKWTCDNGLKYDNITQDYGIDISQLNTGSHIINGTTYNCKRTKPICPTDYNYSANNKCVLVNDSNCDGYFVLGKCIPKHICAQDKYIYDGYNCVLLKDDHSNLQSIMDNIHTSLIDGTYH